ncbi:hypothetical protein THRCLA_00848 [Thraustotheca clavata]|uniref:Uncharacterized protein n=1 Tax=Thraustotheca clavata TaxID=74557 RepID=A0A1W0AA08_9STRA|nr:hypothetical protein THRCLA_00848 [Thraustotheca clavata]
MEKEATRRAGMHEKKAMPPMQIPMAAHLTPMAAYLQMPWIEDTNVHGKHGKRKRDHVEVFHEVVVGRRNEATGLQFLPTFDVDTGKKRAKPIKRMNEVIKLEPKTIEDCNEPEYAAWVKFLLHPPPVWYRDQKGRQTTFNIEVCVTQGGQPDQAIPLASRGYFTVKLLYENGHEVRDQRILDLKEGAFPETNATSTIIKLRINDISSRHQNQKFRVQVAYVSPVTMKVCPALSNATQVLSKQVKRSAPVPTARVPEVKAEVNAEGNVDMTPENVSRASNDSDATVAFSSRSTTPSASPLKVINFERPATPVEVTHYFHEAKPSAVVQWSSTAHGLLTQVQWLPQPSSHSSARVYECPICKAQHQGSRSQARHRPECLLRLLLHYPDIFRPAEQPASPKETLSKDNPQLFRPTPTRIFKRENTEEHDLPSMTMPQPADLTYLPPVSTFHTDDMAGESNVLKSLSRVSVSDNDPDFSTLSSSQLAQFCPPMHSDSTHMLSQFTDAPLHSFVEESITSVCLKAFARGYPAFDRSWSILGYYHYVAQDILVFEAISDIEEDEELTSNFELDLTIRKIRNRPSGRDISMFPRIGDANISSIEDLKQQIYNQLIENKAH